MDSYRIQSYFKNLCKTQYEAYSELKRLKNEESVDTQYLCDVANWQKMLNNTENMITDCIRIMQKENVKIIISSKEEIYALINYYTGDDESVYDIINTADEYADLVPEDEVTNIFWNAYKNKNRSLMCEAYDITYRKDII